MAIETIPITKEGHKQFSAELEKLKSIERPKVIQEIADARSLGDLSENAEYHAARERQGLIEARIAELEDKIGRSQIIDNISTDKDKVRFGAFVTVVDGTSGEEKTFRVVGDIEADIAKNKISISSPIGRALLGKKVDDLVEVRAPKGVTEYTITNISY